MIQDKYLDTVIDNLVINDLNILGILYDEDATDKFKSMKSKDLFKRSKMSESIYRKFICRLTANQFILVNTINKQIGISITEFGIVAIEKSLRKGEIA